MPTRKTGHQVHINNLSDSIKELERVLFDPVIEKALLNLSRTNPDQYRFACGELLMNRGKLVEASRKRVNYKES